MKARELLLECKIAKKVTSDYALGKALEIRRQRITDYMNGTRKPDTYAAVKIALCLRRDPAEIIAILEAEGEKDEKRKAFWVDFLQHVRQAGKFGMLAAVSMMLLFAAPRPAEANTSHNG